ncbi:MAG: peptidyl-tRNA hydrolase Pth2 [Nanoarchaeota archaeon]
MKQVILVRTDLKLPKGKMAAQAAHASVEAVLRSSQDAVDEWRAEGMAKIVLKVENEKQLLDYQQQAKAKKLVAAVITDAGKTVIAPGTKTCVGIGPAADELIDAVTSDLKLM